MWDTFDNLAMYFCYKGCDYNHERNVKKRARMAVHRNQQNPE
jgi:hypothetical protein